MRKFTLLLLAMMAGIGTACADDYLAGSWNSWVLDETTKFSYSGSTGTLTLSLEASTYYNFKLVKNGNQSVSSWMGNGGTMCFNNCTDWPFSSDGGNCTLRTLSAGNYTFTITWSGDTPSISVSYPDTNDDVVYFCNTTNWTNPYAYILHSNYWGDDKGSGSRYQPNGIEMTNISGTNIWKAEFPSSARSGYIAFTKEKQDGYENFYSTEAVYKSDFPLSGTYVYVPSSTESNNLNSTNYYNNGEWHAYPTYTRTVTSGNFGTICLPFAATIEGATIFKITSTVMENKELTGINLESVDALEAGKAYIFKATATTLTATSTGDYTAATEANGMLGNLSSNAINVPQNNYVIGSDNKFHKVIGDAVTCGQYKAYITLNGINAAGSRGANFMAFDNETTAIENVQVENEQNTVYNLQGQRVMKAQKGLFIVNGKKVMK